MKAVISYIDESGGTSLGIDKPGETRHFIVTAVLINPDDKETFDEGITAIQAQHFSGSEIKSSNVGANVSRRLNILQDIVKLNFHSFTLCVDKSEVNKESGLIYKRPFIKYVNGMLYRQLFRSYPTITIFCDQHGSPEFQQSFKRYLEENHRSDLFNQSTVTTVESKSYPGVQIADFIAGSWGKYFETQNDALLNILRGKSIGIDVWPPKRVYLSTAPSTAASFDDIVESYCLNQVKVFIEKNLDSDEEDKKIQVAVLQYLLSRYYVDSDDTYCVTGDIMKSIGYDTEEKSAYYFRTKIIGGLRDEEIIIASSSKGLKIPTSVKDLSGFVDESFKKIMPMLDRLIRARKQIKLTTLSKLDIMEGKEAERSLLDFVERDRLRTS